MAFRRHFSGGPFEAKLAYCRALEADGWIFVSGSTGTDPATGEMPEGVVDQCRNTLATIGRALAEFGAGFGDVVRVTYMLPDRADFEGLLGGADALMELCRHIWWGWPLWLLSRFPGVMRLLRWLYRRVAARRHRLAVGAAP